MTRDHRTDPEAHAPSGAYALDAMDPAERHEFEAHLTDCEACRREVAALQEAAARFGSAAETPPPPAMRARVLDAIGGIAQDPPSLADARRRRQGSREPLFAAAAAVLLVAVMVLGGLYARTAASLDRLEQQVAAGSAVSAELVSVLSAPDAQVVPVAGAPPESGARFVWSQERDAGVLVGDRMPAAPTGHTYTVWLIGPGHTQYAGSFTPGEHGEVAVAVEGGFAAANRIGVTAEPPGVPIEPSGDVLMSATLA
jgi:hypothetical protein